MFRFICKANPSLCLEIKSSTVVLAKKISDLSNVNQIFRINSKENTITHLNNNALSFKKDENGKQIVLKPLDPQNTNLQQLYFFPVEHEPESFTIRSLSGLALTVTENKIEIGSKVILGQCDNRNNQKWLIEKCGDFSIPMEAAFNPNGKAALFAMYPKRSGKKFSQMGIVNVTASSGGIYNVIDVGNNYFCTKDEPNSYIEYHFPNHEINPTGYVIKTYDFGPGGGHLKN